MLGGQIQFLGLSVDPLIPVLIAAVIFLILGYVLGATFSTRGLRAKPGGSKTPQKPVFLKGLSSMLADRTDQAIAELTRAVEADSETVEVYIALGHLYRSKGIFDRAISLRQSIIARPRLDPGLRIQALYDLGVDYRMGGFLSRAIEAFEQVLAEDPRHKDAMTDLEAVLEEIQDWDKALEVQKKLDRLNGKNSPTHLAHLKTERGKRLVAEGKIGEASAAFKKALSHDKNNIHALLSLGDLYLSAGDLKKALATWRRIAQSDPRFSYLALNRVIGKNWTDRDPEAVEEFIAQLAAESRDPWAQYLAARHYAARGKQQECVEALRRVFEFAPGFLPAHRDLGLILLDQGQIDEILTAYQNLVENLKGNGREYQCSNCGFTSGELSWKCPSCRRWGTLEPRR